MNKHCMTKPLISIIVPSYRAAKFLPELCSSVQAQTFSDFEILIVDDGSPDDITAAVKPFLKDSRFRFWSWRINRGVSKATAFALSQMRGAFWCYPGADDILEPEFLASRLDALRSCPTAVLAHGPPKIIDENGLLLDLDSTCIRPDTVTPGSRALQQLLQHNFLNTPSIFARSWAVRKVLPYFMLSWRYAQDWYLWILLAATGGEFLWQSEKLHRYRVHSSSLTGRSSMANVRKAENRLVPLCALAEAAKFSAIAREEWRLRGGLLLALWQRRAFQLWLQSNLHPEWLELAARARGLQAAPSIIWDTINAFPKILRTTFTEKKARRNQSLFVSGIASIDDPLFRFVL